MQEKKLKILYVSAEVSPFAKTGGLADVAGSLPKALAASGNDGLFLGIHIGAATRWNCSVSEIKTTFF